VPTVLTAQTAVDALQAALAGEHAAVYGYGVVGARVVSSADRRAATAAFDTHRQRRSTLTTWIEATGATPVPAAAAYELGGPVTTPAQARALAARIETGVAATYADLVATSTGSTRSTVAAWLSDAAVRQTAWSGRPQTFPGLTERS
jgi:hypothetical protein